MLETPEDYRIILKVQLECLEHGCHVSVKITHMNDQVIERGEGELYMSQKNRFLIQTSSGPEIRESTLFLRGTSQGADNRTQSGRFREPEYARAAYDKAIDTLCEWAASENWCTLCDTKDKPEEGKYKADVILYYGPPVERGPGVKFNSLFEVET